MELNVPFQNIAHLLGLQNIYVLGCIDIVVNKKIVKLNFHSFQNIAQKKK